MRKGFLLRISTLSLFISYLDSITIACFRNLARANGVLTDRIAKTKSFRRRNDYSTGNDER